MKHKIWINFIAIIILVIAFSGVNRGEQPAAQAARTEVKKLAMSGEAREDYTTNGVSVDYIGHIGGPVNSVALVGDYAYIGEGASLSILDISAPDSPTLVGRSEYLPEFVEGVAVVGDHAYVADGESGLRVIDISDLANPIEVGFFDTFGYVSDVSVAGSHAYIPNGSYGLWVIDVSDPTSPTSAGFFDTPGEAKGVAVVGTYAFIADYSGGLRIIDISNPAAPTETGFYDTPGLAHQVAVAGGYAYVADGSYGLWVIDVSDPTSPTNAGFLDTPGNAYDVAVAGTYAYLADYSGGLRIINISNPAAPTEAAFYDTAGVALRVAVAGSYAYVVDDWGMEVIDVSDPANPNEVGSYYQPRDAQHVAVVGNYAYMTDGYTDLWAIDVSDPASPRGVGVYDMPGNAYNLAVADGYAYVAAGSHGLRVIDLSDPANPVEVGFTSTTNTWGHAYDVAVVGDIAYVADGYSLSVVDVSDPANPSEIVWHETPGEAKSVAVQGSYAYVVDEGSGLRVINVSDPANPIEVGNTPNCSQSPAVVVVGIYAYCYGLQVIDVSDPTNPTVIGAGYGTPGPPMDLAVSGDYAFVATGYSGLRVIDVTDPVNLSEAGFYDTPGDAQGVAVLGSYAYMADGERGLIVLKWLEQNAVDNGETITTILSDDPDPSQVGQAFTIAFEVTAESGTPSGVVHVQVAGEAMDCFGTLAGGIGQCEITLNVPAAYTLTAEYTGDDHFLPSSAVEQHQVGDAPAELSNRIFLPNIVRDFCADFFDDFSNPSTGWETGEDEFARYEYLNGEYRILTKNDQFIYLSSAPTCWRENYIVEVDARWVGTPGASYGIVFGIEGDYRWYFTFEVNTDYRDFGVWLVDGDNTYTIVPITPSNAINGGTATNHLKVIRSGTQFTLEINGLTLGTWSYGNIPAKSGVGILSVPYDGEPASDARFDNFSVTRLDGSALETGYSAGAPE